MAIDEEAEQGVENSSSDGVNAESTDSPSSGEVGKPCNKLKKEDRQLRSFSDRTVSCRGKNLRIHIPLTNPTRTFSAISYLLWDDLVNQSSKKCGQEEKKLHINKKKLHHAEKMIRGAFIELYKGLGYLKTYRYAHLLTVTTVL